MRVDSNCPKCGKPVKVKEGKYGEFFGCTGWPKCNFTCSIYDEVETYGFFDRKKWEKDKLNRELEGLVIASYNGG